MKHVSILILGVVFPLLLFAQNQGNIWYFGEKAGLDFNAGSPVPILDGQTYLKDGHNEGCSAISDEEGNLIMYSNGEVIWNKNHQIMPNGSGLLSHYSSSQAALILPKPGDSRYYYVFTVDGFYQNNLQYGFRYSIVDMTLDNGNGNVVASEKNILLSDTMTEKLTAVRHANGRDYWIITHKYWSDEFIAFQLSCNGIVNQVTTAIGSNHEDTNSPNSTAAAIGHIAASPSGNRIGICFGNTNPSKAEIFDFDKATGVVSNWIPLPDMPSFYGVAFSPDESKVYFTADGLGGKELLQFDLNAGTPSDIANSSTTIASPNNILGLQLGPDNKIYSTYYNENYLGVINFPNELGTSCDFVSNGVNLFGRNGSYALPGFVAGYDYKEIENFDLTYNINHPACGEATGEIMVNANGGSPNYSYVWNNGQSGNTVAGLTPGSYRVSTTDDVGCKQVNDLIVSFENNPEIEWGSPIGGSSSDFLRDIIPTNDGGYIGVGETESNDGDVLPNAPNGKDFWVVKFDAAGTIVWQKVYGGSQQDYAYTVLQLKNGDYLVGGKSASSDGDINSTANGNLDYWVIRLDNVGNIIWENLYGGSSEEVLYDMEITPEGNLIIAGASASNDGDVTNGHGGDDYWIVKIDPDNGNLLWEKTFGGSLSEECNAIKLTEDGGYIALGWSNSTDGDVSSSNGVEDFWALKLDQNGNLEWEATYGGSQSDYGEDAVLTADGGYIFVGCSNSSDGNVPGNFGQMDYLAIKVGANGNVQWSKNYGGAQYDECRRIVTTCGGEFVLGGTSYSNAPNGSSDYWVLRIDAAGNQIWEISAGYTNDERLSSIVPTSDGGYILGGYSFSATNNFDFYPAKINATPDLNMSCSSVFGSSDVVIASTGGLPNYMINWEDANGNTGVFANGDGTDTLTNLNTGTYNVSVTDLNGCVETCIFNLGSCPITINTNVTPTACISCIGSIDLTPSGGVAPYSFNWSNGDVTEDVSGLCMGVITVTVTDAAGCVESSSITVLSTNTFGISQIGITNQISCHGDCDGAGSVSATGGLPPYTYQWGDGTTTSTISGLCQGAYPVTVEDQNGCKEVTGVFLLNPPDLTISVTVNSNAACFGESNGNATVTANGGVPPYVYAWSNGGNTPTVNNLPAGPHSVTVTDDTGCFETASLMITEPTLMSTTGSATPTSCTSCIGTATLVTTGGVTPYTYTWSNGANTSSLTGLCAGNYTVTVVDDNGCINTSSLTVSSNNNFNVTGVTVNNNISCNGLCDGSATANATGGQIPYTYQWDSGQNGQVATGLCAGTHAVTITDANGCFGVASTMITEPTILTSSVTGTSTACTACIGSADLTVMGGVTPYTYQWSNGAATEDVSGLCEATYTVTVTDDNGCSNTHSVIIQSTNTFGISQIGIINNVSCNGLCDGVGSVTATGGQSPYNYQWGDGQTTSLATGLCFGPIPVTVTDQNGCKEVTGVLITQPTPVNSSVTTTTTLCSSCVGTADVTVTGGVPPYIFNWSDGTTSEDATGLCAGNYIVTITDSNMCSSTLGVNIQSSNTFGISQIAVDNNVSCNGVCDGQATVMASGGTPPYTYVWSNGDNTPSISGLCAGAYTVTVTDDSGCFEVGNINVTEPPLLTVTSTVNANVSCNGLSDGSGTVNTTGGTPPYVYTWSNGGSTPSITNLPVGNYSITVTDNNGCAGITAFVITEPPLLTATATIDSNVSCNGQSDGSATVSTTGGTPAINCVWSTGATTPSVTGLGAGTYTVSCTDANGCSSTATVTITEPTLLGLTVTSTNLTCNGVCIGTVTSTVTGGVAPYTYTWDSGQSSSAITGLCAGTYNLTVTDGNGCTETATSTITEPLLLTATSVVNNNVSCNGLSDGSATVTVTGGSPPFVYTWNNVGSTATATNLPAGNYSVTVTDNNGCTGITAFVITEPLLLSANATVNNNVSCNGADGSATVTTTGGTPAISCIWSNGATTATVTGLSGGTYTVSCTDANGCSSTATVTITEAPPLSLTVSSTNLTCNAVCIGTATTTVTGGVTPYTYTWDNGQTTPDQTGLCAGNYNLTLTDANGCAETASVTITEPPLLSVNSVVNNDVSCNGLSDGSATVTATGGTPPYVYTWSNGGSTPAITNLPAGNYSITVSDNNGCTEITSFIITQPPMLSATAVVNNNVSCNGAVDGSATVTTTGGTPPINCIWSSGATTATATGLSGGTYTVSCTDANGCSSTATVTITEPTLLSLTVTSTNIICSAVCIGTATTSVTGGVTPYSYTWSNGQTTPNQTGLCAGAYSLTVTDSNGCSETASVTITEPPLLTVTPAVNNNVSCNGLSDGSATVTATGGTPPYVYTWNNGGSTPVITNLPAGNYDITVTDDNGCVQTTTLQITQPTTFGVTITSQNVDCNAACNGSATISTTGGVSPYTYQWSDGQITQTATGLCAGFVNVTVTDSNGCVNLSGALITEPPAFNINLNTQNVLCSGDCDGEVAVAISGGTPPYTYQWSDGQSTQTATGLCAGFISLTITDDNGCINQNGAVITENSILIVSAAVDSDVLCNGQSNGSAAVTHTGGVSPYTYEWSNGATTSNVTDLGVGYYVVTVTDNFGCTTTDDIQINEPSPVAITVFIDKGVSCNGDSNGQAAVLPSGGTSPYVYIWSNGETIGTVTNLDVGFHFVTVTDDNGCSITGSVNMSEPDLLVTAITGTDLLCFGTSAGDATISATGGVMPYLYDWNTGATTTTITGLSEGTFMVTVTDANNCSSTQMITLSEPPALEIDSMNSGPLVCFGNTDGTITFSLSGGTPPYLYNWSNGAPSTPMATGLSSGTYTITVTDDNGCIITASETITEPGQLAVSSTTTDISCNGLCDGTATVSVSGGTPAFNFVWSASANGQTTMTATGLCVGSHTVTITDANSCTTIHTVVVSQPTLVTASAVIVSGVTCFGGSDGSATASGQGGISPYTFLWDNAETTATATGLTAGPHLITVTDSNGCTASTSVIITEPSLLSVIGNGIDASCFGSSDGSASAAATGGTPGYQYTWNTGQTGTTINNLPAGTYTVMVTDANLCTAVTSVTVGQPGAFSATAIGTALTCFGDTNGSITTTINGGIPPFVFLWTGNANPVQNPTGLSAGTYTVTITDDNGCKATASATITQPTQIGASDTTVDVLCAGACDGSATVSATGGAGGYTYLWSSTAGSQTTVTAINLCAGTHFVTVTDAVGCSIIHTVVINQPSFLTANTTAISPAVCFGDANGSATVTAGGGTNPYTFEWDSGETTTIATMLNGGVHYVTVTDDNGCSTTANVLIGQPSAMSMQVTGTDVTCFGLSDGTATAVAFGGNGSYTYSWSTGASGPTVILLPTGTHIVTATDSQGCTVLGSIVINQPSQISAVVTGQDVSCNGGVDGSATVTPLGGNPPFTYLWDNGEITNPAIGLTAGPHTVVITDISGCNITETVTIGAPTALSVSVMTVTPICFGSNDGSATVTLTGGTPPYAYSWGTTPIQTGQTATGLVGGIYVLNVSDANGCQINNINVTVDDAPVALDLTITSIDASCNGSQDGSMTVVTTGGTASYTYVWSDGTTGQTAYNLAAGGYGVTVTDANGCMSTAAGTINHPDEIIPDFVTEGTICFGELNGSITIIDSAIVGGVGPYMYSIDGITYVPSDFFGGLGAGNYTVYVQDANGCVVTASTYVADPPELEVNLGPDILITMGDSAQLWVQVAPDTLGVTFEWSPDVAISCLDCQTPVVDPLETTLYQVMVTDTLTGCTATDDILVTVDKDRNVFIPNVFSPNGDNTNDIFMIYSDGGVGTIRTFNIYDRWGEQVFAASNIQPNNPTLGWDGRFKNQRMDGAVFIYYAVVEFVDGEVVEYKGDVTLVR